MGKENDVKYRGCVITEQDRQFSTIIEGDSFTIQIPNSFEEQVITSAISSATGGVSIASIEQQRYGEIKMIMTLCQVIKKGPDWWEGADNCPDKNLLFELWRFYLEATVKFASRLKTKSKTKSVETGGEST